MAVRTLLKRIRASALVSAFILALAFGLQATLVNVAFAQGVTTQEANRILREQHPQLMGDGTQLVSLYFFGEHQHQSDWYSVIGLERVGDDYLPVRWLLVFREQTLLGWYHPLSEFPLGFKAGHIQFPLRLKQPDVSLVPLPPEHLDIAGQTVQFIQPYESTPSTPD